MKNMRFALSAVLAIGLGTVSFTYTNTSASAAPPLGMQRAAGIQQHQQQFVEVPGELEFSGQMISRPVQANDWAENGISQLEAGANIELARELMQAFELVEYVPETDEYVFKLGNGQTENGIAQELMASGVFQYVEPNWTCYPIACPNDPRLGTQWHHNASRMQSCDGWDLHTGNPTTVVGICDTGIRTTHEEFQQNRQEGYNAASGTRRWENAGGQINDINGHGTMTSGCAAANGNNGRGGSGVGWNLGHRMLRVTNSSGGGANFSDLIHAARTSIQAGDKTVNVSYSGVTSSSVRTTATFIKSIGGLLFWAAGNSGQFMNTNNRDADDVIVVGATTSSDTRAGFSNWGPYVDFMAPGQSVYTTTRNSNASYGFADGTSFSSPLAAGLGALIFSADPSLTPDEVEQILKLSCDDLGANGVDNTYGYGRINVFNAMEAASSQTADLTGFTVVTGTRISGNLQALRDSDDLNLRVRSGFGTRFSELHKMELVVEAVSLVDSPSTLDLSIEGRLDEPGGLAQVSLWNWNTNLFEQVGSYSIGTTEITEDFNGIASNNYINGNDNMKVEIKTLIFVPFFAFNFDTFIDQVRITVN